MVYHKNEAEKNTNQSQNNRNKYNNRTHIINIKKKYIYKKQIQRANFAQNGIYKWPYTNMKLS